MDALLLAGLRAEVEPTARVLWAYVYAHVDGSGMCRLGLDSVCGDLGIGEPSLRRYRSSLGAAGLCESRRVGDELIFAIAAELWNAAADARAAAARVAHVVRDPVAKLADNSADRACGARSSDLVAHVVRDERACGARCTESIAHVVRDSASAGTSGGAEIAHVVRDGIQAAHVVRDSAHGMRDSAHVVRDVRCIDQIDRSDLLTDTGINRSMRIDEQLADLMAGREVADGAPVDMAEQARTAALLTDEQIGISGQVAARIAAGHRFAWVLGQIYTWRHEVAAGKHHLKPGAIVNRCDHGWRSDVLTEKDQNGPYFRRHVPEWETVAQKARENRYVPAAYADIIEH